MRSCEKGNRSVFLKRKLGLRKLGEEGRRAAGKGRVEGASSPYSKTRRPEWLSGEAGGEGGWCREGSWVRGPDLVGHECSGKQSQPWRPARGTCMRECSCDRKRHLAAGWAQWGPWPAPWGALRLVQFVPSWVWRQVFTALGLPWKWAAQEGALPWVRTLSAEAILWLQLLCGVRGRSICWERKEGNVGAGGTMRDLRRIKNFWNNPWEDWGKDSIQENSRNTKWHWGLALGRQAGLQDFC